MFQSQRENTIPCVNVFTPHISEISLLPRISRFVNKYLYRFGIGASINRYNNSFSIYSSKADQSLYSEFDDDSLYVNFGSGAFFHNKWKNYDYPGQSAYYKCIQGIVGEDFFAIDLCINGLILPEEDDTVSLIFCSHTLEHLQQDSSIRFLEECFRIMKKGGVMRVALPNTKNDFFYLQAISKYLPNSNTLSRYHRIASQNILSDSSALCDEELRALMESSGYESRQYFSCLSSNGEHAHFFEFDGSNPGRHINYWDLEKLLTVCRDIGFSQVLPNYQGASVAKPFHNLSVFDNSEPQISFYVDIIK